jgi:GPI mannosyltransferase 3
MSVGLEPRWVNCPVLKQKNLKRLAFFLVAAWFTSGFHHHDEHFQVLEFANLKMGRASEANMPWEWQEQMRPGLQPMLAVGWVRLSEVVGCTDPFFQMILLRLLCGLLTFWAFLKWHDHLLTEEGPDRAKAVSIAHAFLLLATGLWFLPYLSVRFSSEGLATLCFLWGTWALVRMPHTRGMALFSGFLLGLSFDFRYQMGIAVAGILAWMFVVGRPKKWDWACWWLGMVVSVGLGVVADRWMYGHWTLAPFNYLDSNLLSGTMNAKFGTQPIWWYFPQAIVQMVPPIGLAVLAFAGLGFTVQKRHPWVWAMVPFIVVHTLIGHKELRFLFPALPMLLLLTASGWSAVSTILMGTKWWPSTYKFLWGINLALLLAASFRPALDAAPYYAYIYKAAKDGPITLHCLEKNPYEHVGLPTTFYKHPNLRVRVWERFDPKEMKTGDLVLWRNLYFPDGEQPLALESAYCYFPDWIKHLNFGDWQSRTRIWSIYRI